MANSVLLTGAGGFIGRNIQKLLIAAGYEVQAITSQRITDIQPDADVKWYRVDLRDCIEVNKLIKNLSPDYLLHLAWDTTPGIYLESPKNIDWVTATLGLCKAFYENGGKRAVFAGTCFEYDLYNKLKSENSRCLPSSLYGTCKLALSGIIDKYCTEQGISFAWARIFYLFGPFENEKRVIPYVIKSLLDGKEALCSSGYGKKDYLYVEDVAAALIHLLNIDDSGIFNIGSGSAVPLKNILLMIAKFIGKSHLLKLGELYDVNESAVVEADVSKLYKTGFLPKYSLKEGLEKTIAWWMQAKLTLDQKGKCSNGIKF